MKKNLLIVHLILVILLLNTMSIIGQDIIVIEPNDNLLCTSESYIYVAQLDGATNFCWEVENPFASPQPTFSISGVRSDTISINWQVPSLIQDILNFHIITVIAKNNDTPIDTLEIYVENIIEAPTPLPMQQITQVIDTVACGDMTNVIYFTYPSSSQQEFTATLDPEEAGEIISYSQWSPLQDPTNITNIYWDESYSGSATATITTFNDCGIDVEEYHYFKALVATNADADYFIFGQDSICEYKTTYIITDSTDVLVNSISIIPEDALELVISRDSFYFQNGSAIAVKYIDVYWDSEYSGNAQLVLHNMTECSTNNALINNFINVDTLNLSICEEITGVSTINYKEVDNIEVFPNPIKSGNIIYFDTQIQLPVDISIIEVSTGRIVQYDVLINLNRGFKLSPEISNGLYIIQMSIVNSQKQYYSKLIVQD